MDQKNKPSPEKMTSAQIPLGGVQRPHYIEDQDGTKILTDERGNFFTLVLAPAYAFLEHPNPNLQALAISLDEKSLGGLKQIEEDEVYLANATQQFVIGRNVTAHVTFKYNKKVDDSLKADEKIRQDAVKELEKKAKQAKPKSKPAKPKK